MDQPRLLDNNSVVHNYQRLHHHNGCSIVLFVLNIVLIEKTGKICIIKWLLMHGESWDQAHLN